MQKRIYMESDDGVFAMGVRQGRVVMRQKGITRISRRDYLSKRG